MKNLYYFERIMGHKLTPPILFPCDNVDRVVSAILNFERLFRNIFRSNALQSAYNEFYESYSAFEIHHQTKLVERRARSYFVEFSVHIAHWEEYINNLAQKPRLKQFFQHLKEYTKKSCKEYFIAKLIRNYAVHFDEIIERFHVNSDGTELYFMRDNLFKLNSMRGIKNKRNIQKIQQLPKEIALIPVIDKSYDALMKIHEQLIDFLIDERTQEDCSVLLELHSRIICAGLESKIWKVFDGLESLNPLKPTELEVLNIDWQGYLMVASYIKDREISECLTR